MNHIASNVGNVLSLIRTMLFLRNVNAIFKLNVVDYTREIHTISTHGIKHPKGETQVVQIEGKKDRYEIQRVTIGSEQSDSCRVDLSFKQNERGFKNFQNHYFRQ